MPSIVLSFVEIMQPLVYLNWHHMPSKKIFKIEDIAFPSRIMAFDFISCVVSSIE